jgi:DNA-binding MarR family transcriptional regulator
MRICAYSIKAVKVAMTPTSPEFCTCLAIRQAARHVSQFYDQHLAPCGLRITQFSILAKLKAEGPLTINRLAEVMVMDRTTLGRNILPLHRDGLIAVAQGSVDRRSKELHLTVVGLERLNKAWTYWAEAQAGFDAAFGSHQDSELRALMRAVTATELVVASTEP